MPLTVHLPSQLRPYFGRAPSVLLEDHTLEVQTPDGALWALDRAAPGFRFRVVDEQGRLRRHMLLFLGDERVEDLHQPLLPGKAITLVGALSGG